MKKQPLQKDSNAENSLPVYSATFDVAKFCACIDKSKITDQSFLCVSRDQLGVSLDLVFSESESGWEDSQLIALEEAPLEDTVKKYLAFGRQMRKALGIHKAVVLDDLLE